MKLFFADTETTGLDPNLNEIFQLAYLIEIDGKTMLERNLKLRPEKPETISDEALAVTKKTRAEILAYPPRAEAFKTLIKDMAQHVDRFDKTDKFVWIGQNPDFDQRFLRALFRDMGDKYFGSWFDRRPADLISLAVAAKIKGLIDPPDFKLGSLAAAFGISFDAHDALADVQVTRQVWEKLSAFLVAPVTAPKREQLDLGI